MLTPKQKTAIRAEELFREKIRNEIASARRHQQRGRKLWDVCKHELRYLVHGVWSETSPRPRVIPAVNSTHNGAHEART
jgi:hypothetical protein